MRRRFFNLAAAVSLLTFFVGIAVFAFYRHEPLCFGNTNKWCSIQARKEEFTVQVSVSAAPAGPLVFEIWHFPFAMDLIRTNQAPGRSRNAWVYRLDMPFLLFIPVTLLLPAVRFRLIPINVTRRQKRRLKRRQCLMCGYDLRASPERCPECGTTVPLAAHATSEPT